MPIFGRHINKTKAIPLVAKRVIEFNNARNIGDTALNSAERAMSESLLDGFSMIRPEEFEKLVSNIYYTGYEKEVERAFSVIESELASELHKQLVESAKAEAKELSQQFISALTKAELPTPAEITMAFSFNAQSPEALKWARDESSKLVTNMKKDQLAVVRRIVGQSFGAGETRAGTSKNLRAILSQVSPGTDAGKLMARTLGVNANGLTVRYEQALFNRATQLANTLTAQGIEGTKALEKIKTDTNKYAEKLRRQRARTIARTETMMAYNEGKQQAWNQAADRGLINKQTARKVWVTGPMDVCTICAPLNGQNQPINKPFSIKRMTPPAHPNCRCTMVLNASPKGRPTQGLGTGTPGDPYRVSVPEVPNLDDFPPLPRLDTDAVPSAPRPRTPSEGFNIERRVVGGEDIEFHVHSDGRIQVPGTDIERDPTGRWFRTDKNGAREEFIPSRNSAAGKIERAVKGGSPTPPKPITPEPTPPIVPEPTPQPRVLDRQEFKADGKIPAFRINSDGSIQLPDTYFNGSPVRRTADGKWERIAEPNGNYYVEFTPSQNSAAGQLERHLKRNKFKPGEEFKPTGGTPPTPTQAQPTTPEPVAVETVKPSLAHLKVQIDDLLEDAKRMPRVGLQRHADYDSWIGNDETEDVRRAMDAFDEIGRRIEAMIERELLVRGGDEYARVKAIEDEVRSFNDALDKAKSEELRARVKATAEMKKYLTDNMTNPTARMLVEQVEFETNTIAHGEIMEYNMRKLYDAVLLEGDTPAGNALARGLLDFGFDDTPWSDIVQMVEGRITSRYSSGGTYITNANLQWFSRIPEVGNGYREVIKANEARMAFTRRRIDLHDELHKARSQLRRVSNDVVRDVLQATRPNFGQSTNMIGDYFSDIKIPRGVTKKLMNDALEDIRTRLPAEWVDDTFSQTRGSGWTMNFGARGHNSAGRRHIQLSGSKDADGTLVGGWRSTLTHEFQHSTQMVPGVADSEYAIFNRLARSRGITKGTKPQRYAQGEYAFDLGVDDLYTGKMYNSQGYTEVTTRGLERLFHESWKTYEPDQVEMIMFRRYLLGILAAL
jgi:hypothetical protein